MSSERRELTLITGTGRSGTTVFIQFLNELGFEIRPRAGAPLGYNTAVRGGIEYVLGVPNSTLEERVRKAPEIVKDPRLCIGLEALIAENVFDVYMVFVCVRDLVQASKSRMNYNLEYVPESPQLGCDLRDKLSGFDGQLVFNQRALGYLFQTMTLWDLPFMSLSFPRFAHDPEYLFNKLKDTKYAVEWSVFVKAHSKIFDTRVIKNY